ncbi:MAG TPA: Ig-like domain-containing protein, partial [bacterium]|nr:Ig-like domain-containing protein [bacterium]
TDSAQTSIPADGKTTVEIEVVVFDIYGNPIPGIEVSISGKARDAAKNSLRKTNFAVTGINPDPKTTDSLGRAVFTITSDTPGDFELQAFVNGTEYGPAFRVAFAAVPLALSDVHAYPNPWNPSQTRTLCFAANLSGTPEISATVYDIRGKTVRELYASAATVGTLAPDGTQKNLVCWDGANNGGRQLASGVYMYKLTATDGAGAISTTGKFSVVR